MHIEIAPKTLWPWLGKLGIVTCFILLSFYSVVGGWILLYLWNAITGRLWEGNGAYEATFGEIISNPYLAVGSQLLFILITIFIVSKGVQNGVEKVNKYFMPALFVLFFVLIVRALTLDGAGEGVRFFLQPDFSHVTSEVILYAMGQSFFSLSVGVAVMVTYSSYLPKEEKLTTFSIFYRSLNSCYYITCRTCNFPSCVRIWDGTISRTRTIIYRIASYFQ